MQQALFQITINYTLAMLKQSVIRYCKRVLGWRYLLAMIFIACCLITAFIKQDTSWMTGAMAVIFTFGLIFALSLYLNNKHHVIGTFNALQKPTITFSIYQEKFALSSELGQGEWPWSAIKEIWQYPNSWLVFLTHNSYATFPLDAIPSQAQHFVLQQVQNAGGIIK